VSTTASNEGFLRGAPLVTADGEVAPRRIPNPRRLGRAAASLLPQLLPQLPPSHTPSSDLV
jgi:hypothetical protein